MKTFLTALFIIAITANIFSQSYGKTKVVTDICSLECSNDSDKYCFCNCLVRAGYQLLSTDSVLSAIETFQLAEDICREPRFGAIADSVLQNHRDWKFNGTNYAIFTLNGTQVTPYQYNNPSKFKAGYSFFEHNGKYFFIDKDGVIIRPHEGVDGIIPMKGNVYGLVKQGAITTLALTKNPNLRIMLPSGKISEEFDNEEDLIDFTEFVIDKGYEEVYGPFNGLGRMLKNGKYGLYSKNRKELAAPTYTKMGAFHENRLWVKGSKNAKFGFLNNKGEEIIPLIYDTIANFREGFAIAKKGSNWGFIDTLGKPLGSIQYEAVSHFSNGWAWFKSNGLWGIVNKRGTIIQPAVYQYQYDDYLNGFFINNTSFGYRYTQKFVSKKGKNIFLYRSGNNIKEFAINERMLASSPANCIQDMLEGRIAVRVMEGNQSGSIHNTWKLFDTLNNPKGKLLFAEIYPFTNGFAPAAIPNDIFGMLWGAIDREGKWVINPKFGGLHIINDSLAFFTDIQSFTHGIINLKSKEVIVSSLVEPPIYEADNLIWGATVPPGDSIKLYALYRLDGKPPVIPPTYEAVGNFSEGLAAVRKNGKWGYIDTSFNEVITPRFQAAYDFIKGLALIKYENKWQFINKEGLIVTQNSLLSFGERLTVFRDGKNLSLTDLLGNRLIDFQASQIQPLSKTICKIQTAQGRWGLINDEGYLFVDTSYAFMDDKVCNGMIRVQNEMGLWGFVNIKGGLIQAVYKEAQQFSESLCWVKKQDGHWMLIDTLGIPRSAPLDLEIVNPFSDGRSVTRYNGNWKIINTNGNFVPTSALDFDHIDSFVNGYARVNKHGNFGIIDSMGNLMIECKYEYIEPLNNKYFAARVKFPSIDFGSISRWGVIDVKGSTIIAFKYNQFYELNNGTAIVLKDSMHVDPEGNKSSLALWGVIDLKDSIIIPFIYKDISYDERGKIFFLEIDENNKLMVHAGDKFVQLPFLGQSTLIHLDDNAALIISGSKRGVIYLDEKKIIPANYEELYNVNRRLVMVRKDSKLGWVDHEGNTRIACLYDAATPFLDNLAMVYQHNILFHIDESGEMIWWYIPSQ